MKAAAKPLFHRFLLFFCFFGLMFFFSTCKKDDPVQIILPQFDSIADIENNYYTTVKIGNQWWMAEDLKVKLFNDSSIIFDGQNDNNWIKNRPSYCLYQNNKDAPGLLYNGFAVLDAKKIAPKGWHIPTDEEWKELEKHIGLSQESAEAFGWRGNKEGSKLKTFGRKSWLIIENSTWPTNETGFSANAGSNRLYNGVWGDPGLASTGFWWSATEFDSQKLFYRHLDYKNTNIFRNYESKFYGFSIRCIKDN
jgi:uncharacterized protein (TIGR02145 family)